MNPAPKPPDESTYAGRFAARLRMLREKTGMTGQELAKELEVAGYATTATTYYRWETGLSEPPLKAFPALAMVLKQKSPRTLLPTD